jgi:hypothetical protein
MGVAREPDLYRCAIGYAGVYDLELRLESGKLPDTKSGKAFLERTLAMTSPSCGRNRRSTTPRTSKCPCC